MTRLAWTFVIVICLIFACAIVASVNLLALYAQCQRHPHERIFMR
jgi:hypothetical protein